MPLHWALLFACANPLGFAVLVLGYRAIAIPLHLRAINAILYYTLLAFVASVFSSAGALIWCYTNLVDPTGLLPIWQGCKLVHLARTDTLTGLPNRRALEEALEQQMQRSRRSGGRASLVLLDIDHFKAVNDHYGHDTGDAVICALAETMRETILSVDVAGRWGGEEFLVVLADVDEEDSTAFAERLRRRMESAPVQHGKTTVSYTISLGVAPVQPSSQHYEAWLKRADEALYCAKVGGRNRTAVAHEHGEAFSIPPPYDGRG